MALCVTHESRGVRHRGRIGRDLSSDTHKCTVFLLSSTPPALSSTARHKRRRSDCGQNRSGRVTAAIPSESEQDPSLAGISSRDRAGLWVRPNRGRIPARLQPESDPRRLCRAMHGNFTVLARARIVIRPSKHSVLPVLALAAAIRPEFGC